MAYEGGLEVRSSAPLFFIVLFLFYFISFYFIFQSVCLFYFLFFGRMCLCTVEYLGSTQTPIGVVWW